MNRRRRTLQLIYCKYKCACAHARCTPAYALTSQLQLQVLKLRLMHRSPEFARIANAKICAASTLAVSLCKNNFLTIHHEILIREPQTVLYILRGFSKKLRSDLHAYTER